MSVSIHLRSGPNSLEPQTSHGAFGHRGSLLKVLEHQLAARGPHFLDPIGLGVVRQPAPIGDPLDHDVF